MNNKHTPGPWTMEVFDNEAFILNYGPSAPQGITSIRLKNAGINYGESMANAKLLAAAPELLAALEGLLKTAPVGDISRIGKAEWEANGVIVPNYAKVLAAREAIAKATT